MAGLAFENVVAMVAIKWIKVVPNKTTFARIQLHIPICIICWYRRLSLTLHWNLFCKKIAESWRRRIFLHESFVLIGLVWYPAQHWLWLSYEMMNWIEMLFCCCCCCRCRFKVDQPTIAWPEPTDEENMYTRRSSAHTYMYYIQWTYVHIRKKFKFKNDFYQDLINQVVG